MKTVTLATTKLSYKRYRANQLVETITKDLLKDITPVLTLAQFKKLTTEQVEARAAALLVKLNTCSDFEQINNIIKTQLEEDDFMIGQIIDYAGSIHSVDANKWRECDGAAINISEFPELYAIIGKLYGGNNTQFNLPNYGGRFMVGAGKATEEGDTNPDYELAQHGGETTHKLTVAEMPEHDHDEMVFCATAKGGNKPVGYSEVWDSLHPSGFQTGLRGGNKAHENRPPFIVVTKLIRVKL